MSARRLSPKCRSIVQRTGLVSASVAYTLLTLLAFLGLTAVTGCDDRAAEQAATSARFPGESSDAESGFEETGAALRTALAPEDALQRVQAVSQVLAAADATQLAAVRAVFDDPTVSPTLLEDAVFISWWSRFDQRGPLEWTQEYRRSAGIFSVLFEEWGQVDPSTGASILAGQDLQGSSGVPAIFVNDAKEGLLRGWYESGKPGLFSYLTAIDTKQGGVAVLENFGRYLVAKRGAEGALEFLASIPEDQRTLRSRMLMALATPLTRASPEAGVELFGQYRNEPEAPNLLISIAEGWVDARGGEAAMEWVLAQQDHPRLRAASSTVFRRWIQIDRGAAMSWLEPRLENVPPELEGALVVFIGFKSQDDMLRALELRKQIGPGLVRRDVTLKLLRDWRRKDSDAANAWIDQATTLSDYVRKQLDRERDKSQISLQGERPE